MRDKGKGTYIERAAQRCQDLKRLADLRGRLARFEIDDEAQADASGVGKLVLPQASGLAGGSHDVADLGGGEVAPGHDIYRTGKYHEFRKNVYKNFPLGKACAAKHMLKSEEFAQFLAKQIIEHLKSKN